jgi:glycosyltransferase involved in cell wall biosynthesis
MAGAQHGGAETAYVDMCIAMAEAGHEIQAVTRANELRVGQLEAAGIKTYTLPFGGPLDIYTPYCIRKIISGFRPQIVQTWMSRAAQRTPAWKKGSSVPRYLLLSRLGGYYKRSHFKNTDYFTTITPDIKRHLVESGVPSERVKHINNFAETEQVSLPADRGSLNTPEGAPLVLALGRLHQAKAFDTLMLAIKPLEGVYLWIAGEGPLRAQLEAFCKAHELEDRVRFLGWRDDRAALLQAADVCVFSSRYEPFGTVFVQAWAQKTPLVTTNADGPRQFVRHEQDGLVVDVDDAGAMEGAIKRVLDDKDLAYKLTESGFERYQNEFSKEKTVKAYEDYYSQLLEKEHISLD